MTPLPSRLLAVTDRHQAVRPLPEQVAMLLGAGVRWIWLRERDLPADERRRLAELLQALAAQAGAVLTVGADVELASAVGAAGVHLRRADEIDEARRRLGPAALIGVSAHSPAEVAGAAEHGADYATLSPIFASASKPGYGPALGPAALGQAAVFGLPVLALGGVTMANSGDCIAKGAAGVALMGEMMRARDTRNGLSALPSGGLQALPI